MKRMLLIAISLIVSLSAPAQILSPVKWSYLAKKTSKTDAILMIRATMIMAGIFTLKLFPMVVQLKLLSHSNLQNLFDWLEKQ